MADARASPRARHHPVAAPDRGVVGALRGRRRGGARARRRRRARGRLRARRGSMHPRFIAAVADARATRRSPRVPAARAERDAPLVFTAHSIPIAMAAALALRRRARRPPPARVAERARPSRAGRVAYQSRSGSPARSVARARRRRRRSATLARRRGARRRRRADRLRLRSRRGAVRPRRRGARGRRADAGIALPPRRRRRTTTRRSSRCSPTWCRAPGAPDVVKLVVVGGGIAGLAAAHRAVELARERGLALDLTLLEARRPSRRHHRHRARATASSSRRRPTRSSPRSRGRSRSAGGSASRTGCVRTDDRFRRTFVVWRRARCIRCPRAFSSSRRRACGPFLASSLFSLAGQAPHGARPRAAARRRATTRASAHSCAGASAARRSSASPSRSSRGIYTADPGRSQRSPPPCRASSRSSGASAA